MIFTVLGILCEGPGAARRPDRPTLLAVAYLAVAVTALAFLLWYAAVSRLGANQAGLLTGVAPIAAVVAGIALGGRPPHLLVWAGVAIVAAGLALGLTTHRSFNG